MSQNSKALAAKILNLPLQQLPEPGMELEGACGATPQQIQTTRQEGEIPDTNKRDLNDLCSKIMKRQMTKADTVYKTRQVDRNAWQCKVFIRCLPDPYGESGFLGE